MLVTFYDQLQSMHSLECMDENITLLLLLLFLLLSYVLEALLVSHF